MKTGERLHANKTVFGSYEILSLSRIDYMYTHRLGGSGTVALA